MNTKFFTSALIAAASLVSVNAFAAGADNAPEQKSTFMSMQTRAEVRAAALSVKKGPVTASNQVSGGTLIVGTSNGGDRSRDDVRAEAINAGKRFGSAPGRA
jgi:hypothetical protein